jgi:hypothetical protein
VMTERSGYQVIDSESTLPPAPTFAGAAILFPALWSSTLHGPTTTDHARTVPAEA